MGQTERCAVVILAAGSSTRMGTDKAFLKIDKETTFLDRILDIYSGFRCDPLIVVVNSPVKARMESSEYSHPSDFRIVVNHFPDQERFSSIIAGMKMCLDVDFCFLQDVDQPFIHNGILSRLFEFRDPYSYAVPVFWKKGGHPLLLGKQIIRVIPDSGNNAGVILKDFLKEFPRIEVNVDFREVLEDIDSPEDYRRFYPGQMIDKG